MLNHEKIAVAIIVFSAVTIAMVSLTGGLKEDSPAPKNQPKVNYDTIPWLDEVVSNDSTTYHYGH